MALDARLSSHPVEVDVPDAKMINQVSPVCVISHMFVLIAVSQIFDALSYKKAASGIIIQ